MFDISNGTAALKEHGLKNVRALIVVINLSGAPIADSRWTEKTETGAY